MTWKRVRICCCPKLFWRSNAQHKSHPSRQEKFMKGCSSWTKPRQVELFLPFKVQVMHRIIHFTDNFYVLLFTFNRSWEVEKKYANSLIFFQAFHKKKLKIYFLIFRWFLFHFNHFDHFDTKGRNNSVVLQKRCKNKAFRLTYSVRNFKVFPDSLFW